MASCRLPLYVYEHCKKCMCPINSSQLINSVSMEYISTVTETVSASIRDWCDGWCPDSVSYQYLYIQWTVHHQFLVTEEAISETLEIHSILTWLIAQDFIIHWKPCLVKVWGNWFSYTKLRFSLKGAYAILCQEIVHLLTGFTIYNFNKIIYLHK
jgi:hypothetical protein